MTDQQKSGAARVGLYLHYLVSTCSFRTYGSWTRAGMPNPFLGRRRRREVTREEVLDTFRDTQPRRPLSHMVNGGRGPIE